MYYIITRKKLFLSFFILLILCIFGISSFTLASNTTSWGLCFNNPNEVPRGNASAEELLKYNAYFTGNTEEKKIYIKK